MTELLTTVKLAGELGAIFKPEYQGVAYTLRESLQMLYSQEPEIKHHFINSLCQYQLVLGEANIPINPEHYDFPIAGKTLVIVPVLEGSGTVGRLIGGLALVGLGVLTGGTSLIVAGAVMAAQSLFFGYGASPSDEEQKRSEILGTGNLNTAEGNPIQMVYGNNVMVGSLQVLSFAIKSEYTSL